MLRVGTYNVRDYLRSPTELGERARYMTIAQVVAKELRPDILATQEIPGEGGDEALQRLAADTGLTCALGNGRYAAAAGGHSNLGLGFLWNPALGTPIKWEVYGEFWHALVGLTFVHNDVPVTYYNYHAAPRVGRPDAEVNAQRIAEAQRVWAKMVGNPHAFLMGDFNSLWAELVNGHEYDPDPVPLNPSEHHYETSPLFNRDPAKVFYDAGLRDVAVTLGYEWKPTTGHWLTPPERNGLRRLDRFLFTPAMRRTLRQYDVVRSLHTISASNHLPAYVDYEPASLVRP